MGENKVVIFSRNKLSDKEINSIRDKFNLNKNQRVENIVDSDLNEGFAVVLSDKKERVKIFSVHQLSNEEISNIKEKFNINKDYEIENIIDKNLIAGCIMVYDNKVFDLSLRGRLNKLKNILCENITN